MKKFGSQSIIINFVTKSIFTSIICVLLLSAFSSLIFLKLDLDLVYSKYASIFIMTISSLIVSFVSTHNFKNSGGLMGVFSSIPLIIIEIITLFFGENTFVFFVIKFVVILIISYIIGYVSVSKNKKIRL